MSRKRNPDGLPGVIERRDLLYGKEARKADHGALATRYLEAGRLADALEFFAKAGDPSSAHAVRDRAVADGDIFVLQQFERLTGETLGTDLWREAAGHAERAGKLAYARVGYEKAGDQDALARLFGNGGEADRVAEA